MGLFSFFRSESNKSKGKRIAFAITIENKNIVKDISIGDYVNLWTKENVKRVNIYLPSTVGGQGSIGFVPKKYNNTIRNHLLSSEKYSIAKSFVGSYNANIEYIKNNTISICVDLVTLDEQNKRTIQCEDNIKESVQIELGKKYNLKKSVEIKMRAENRIAKDDLKDIQLKIFDKDYYISNYSNLRIELVADNRTIAYSTGQKSKVLRLIKSNISGQKLNLQIKDYSEYFINIIISPD